MVAGAGVGAAFAGSPRPAGGDVGAAETGTEIVGRAPAEEAVKAMIVLDEVSRRENLEVSDEDLDREVAGYAERSGRSTPAARAQLEKDGELERLRTGLRRERAGDGEPLGSCHARVSSAQYVMRGSTTA